VIGNFVIRLSWPASFCDDSIGKKIAVLGFAFKADTGDTRESPAIDLINHFLSERARITVYDPEVQESQIMLDLTDYGSKPAEPIKKAVTVCQSAMEACSGADGERWRLALSVYNFGNWLPCPGFRVILSHCRRYWYVVMNLIDSVDL
jgi:hypothetical protein